MRVTSRQKEANAGTEAKPLPAAPENNGESTEATATPAEPFRCSYDVSSLIALCVPLDLFGQRPPQVQGEGQAKSQSTFDVRKCKASQLDKA